MLIDYMKESTLLLLLMLFCASLKSQHLKGSVSDYKGQPCASLEILVFNNLHKVATVSSDSGSFSIAVPAPGNYLLMVRKEGKVLLQKELLINSNIIEYLVIQPEPTLLDDVTVSSTIRKKMIERKSDRIIFNVENSIYITGGDVTDAIKAAPGIRFINDQISIIGKSGVVIFIDNRPLNLTGEDLIAYLRAIRADDVKNIEIISNPPAQYEAEGNSGIININLKKTGKDKWNGSVTGTLRQSLYTRADESAQLSYNNKKLSAYANIRQSQGTAFYRTEEEDIDYPDKQYRSHSNMKTKQRGNIGLTAGFDYAFNSKWKVGFQYLHSTNKTDAEDLNDTYLYANPNHLIQTTSGGRRENISNNLNVHLTFQTDSLGSNISFNGDYFDYTNRINNSFTTKEYEHFTKYLPERYTSADNRSYQPITNYACQTDLTQIVKGMEFNAGIKVSGIKSNSWFRYFDNTSGGHIPVAEKSNQFNYKENIQAVYFSGSRKWESLELKAGLRIEHTTTEGYSADEKISNNDYTRLFPTAYLMYKINDKLNTGLNYGRRIQRPRYASLNPFVRYITPYNTSQGNPLLQPYLTNNIELFFHYKEQWTSNLYVNWSDNVFGQLNYISAANINSATKYENFYNQVSFGLSESYTFYPVRIWESYTSADLYYRKIKSSIPQTASDYSNWSSFVESTNNIQLNKLKTLFFSVNYWYQFPEYYAVYYNNAYSCLSIGFKVLLANKKLSVTLNSEDLLRTQKIKNETYFNNLLSHNRNYEDRRCMRISIRYNFGKKQTGTKVLQNSNQEEKGRL